MNNDYTNYAVMEAVSFRISEDFVDAIKRMDRDVAVGRLRALMISYRQELLFTDLAARFISLINCKTSADE